MPAEPNTVGAMSTRLAGRAHSFPARKPALGWYDEGTPEVTDWEITWALDHGISFFVPCWYRKKGNLGQPVEHVLGHWLHEGLFNSRYGDRFQFAILWENGNAIACGVADEDDLLKNLVPYWVEHYFSRPNYLRVGGKPVLFIYRPEELVEELGGPEATRAALDKARQAVREAGLGGLLILGEHHHRVDRPVPHLRTLGLDAAYSYHWPTFCETMPDSLDDPSILAAQRTAWERARDAFGLPTPITASMGWDSRPWGSSFSKARWRLSPSSFQALLEDAREAARALPGDAIDTQLVLLDNWNEFAEGHYIAPHREHGFGYLDAVRAAFAPGAAPHQDLVPEDIGLGPYNTRDTAAR